MRADRLLSIVLLLQVHRRLTAGELAKRLEVSRRTIYRDMDVLSAAGIPVTAERGTGGGWYLLEPYQTKLTGLNPTEIQALFLPQSDRLLADLGLRQASEAALVKLLAALPAMYRSDAEYVRQRIHIDSGGGQHADEDIRFLPTVQAAIWQEHKLQLVYHLSTGPVVEPVLDPLGLVAKGSVWYLVAVYEGTVCVYRVSRIHAAQVLDDPCTRPEKFDLAAFWRQSSEVYAASRARYPATVRVVADMLPTFRQVACRMESQEVDPPDEEGWTRMAVTFDTEEDARRTVIHLGMAVEVLEPRALREWIVELAEGITALYT
jgi:predicted DNA-binding transcriptional regulator YafY